jgi:uncharacterized protein (TIGR01777 family)
MTILLTGASGMLGAAIGSALRRRGVRVMKLVRREPKGLDELRWDPAISRLDEPERLEGLDAAVHLSGASVASRRWTAGYKHEMTESRVASTQFLSETLAALGLPPSVLVKASAVGVYGDRGDEILDENSPAGSGYFPELCTAWETAACPAADAGIRVVHLRFGVVLGPKGGAMDRLRPLFQLGLGGRLGSGRQWMSWISEADAVAAALVAVNNPAVSGAVNVVAPQPVTNTDFTRELARAVRRPALLPVPAFALRLAFGAMADEALLASTRALPTRLIQAGFAFSHPTLSQALAAALAK